MPVKVMEAKAMPVNDASAYVATLKSRDSAVIMPQVEGQITQIFVHSGDRVAEGSALMEILCSLVLLLRPIQLRLLCRAGALLAQLSNFLILVLDPTSVRTRRRPDSELLAIR